MGEENWQSEISLPMKIDTNKRKIPTNLPKVFHGLINGCVLTYTLSHIRTRQAAEGSKIKAFFKAFFLGGIGSPLLAPPFVLSRLVFFFFS